MNHKIFVDGYVMDSDSEFEIKVGSTDTECAFGFNAHVIFTDGESSDYHNCTEIHHLYDAAVGKRIAFESDIHWTGCTLDVTRISFAYITTASKKHDHF